jgi:hypothetical protein
MNSATQAFYDHVQILRGLAEDCADEPRMLDAIRTLGGFCLLLEGWRPNDPDPTDDDPDPGDEAGADPGVIDLRKWRAAVALKAAA